MTQGNVCDFRFDWYPSTHRIDQKRGDFSRGKLPRLTVQWAVRLTVSMSEIVFCMRKFAAHQSALCVWLVFYHFVFNNSHRGCLLMAILPLGTRPWSYQRQPMNYEKLPRYLDLRGGSNILFSNVNKIFLAISQWLCECQRILAGRVHHQICD